MSSVSPQPSDIPQSEVPLADALEQRSELVPETDEAPAMPVEVTPADVVEQHQSVPTDDDEYR